MKSIESVGVIPVQIEGILNQFVDRSLNVYDTHIKRIILFGSYARGDYNNDSDVDIMVLVDYPREEVPDYTSDLSGISYDISSVNDYIDINPIMQNEDFFDKWVKDYPFYHNVDAEGVEIYGR